MAPTTTTPTTTPTAPPYDSSSSSSSSSSTKCDVCDCEHGFQLLIFADDYPDDAYHLALCPEHVHLLGDKIEAILIEERKKRNNKKENGFV